MELSFIAMFIAGFLAGGHCLMMCGGIAHLIGFSAGKNNRYISLSRIVFYNFGRIFSYTLLGALLGLVGEFFSDFGKSVFPSNAQSFAQIMHIVAAVFLIAMGLYIAGFTKIFTPLERLGLPIWKLVEPLAQKFLPPKNFWQCYMLGILWGFLPCGIVYAALIKAFSSTSIINGALLMLCFGVGTFPNLVLISWGSAFIAKVRSYKWVNWLSGLILIVFGIKFLGIF